MDSTTSNTQTSQKDKQLKCSVSLKEASSRLTDLATELDSIHNILIDEKSSQRSKNSSLKTIKQTLIPFINATSSEVMKASSILAPISGCSYVHKRNEGILKNEVKKVDGNNEKIRKSLPFKSSDIGVPSFHPQYSFLVDLIKGTRTSSR